MNLKHSTATFALLTLFQLHVVKGTFGRAQKRVSVIIEPRVALEEKPQMLSQYTGMGDKQAEIQGALPTDDKGLTRGFGKGDIEPSAELLNEVLTENQQKDNDGLEEYKSKEADEDAEGEERQRGPKTSINLHMEEPSAMDKNLASEMKDLQDSTLKDALFTHNRLRALHHVAPLQWNESLSQQAQQIADTLAVDPSKFQGEDSGENIAQIWHEQARAAVKATHIWYSEKRLYSYAYPQISDKVRHFTQLVWKDSKQLGLGAAQSPTGKYVIVVALYRPPGNQATQMRGNVFQSGADRDVYATIKARIPKPSSNVRKV